MGSPLQERPGWRVNSFRGCWEQGPEELPARIYPGPPDDPVFVISAYETWIEGRFASFDEAERAVLAEYDEAYAEREASEQGREQAEDIE